MTPEASYNIARFVDLVLATIARKQIGTLTYKVKAGEIAVTIQHSKTPGNLMVRVTAWSGYDMSPAALTKILPRLIEYHCEELEPKEETK